MFIEVTVNPRTEDEHEVFWLLKPEEVEEVIAGCGFHEPEHPLALELANRSRLCADLVKIIPEPRYGIQYKTLPKYE